MILMLLLACGADESAFAATQTEAEPIRKSRADRQAVRQQREHLREMKRETRCMKAYVRDMRTQQQGVQPDWEQPDLDVYMEQEKCEPYLVNLKR